MTKREIVKRINQQVNNTIYDRNTGVYIEDIEKSRELILDTILKSFVTKNIFDVEILGAFSIDSNWVNIRWLLDVKINDTISMIDDTIYDCRNIDKGEVIIL